MIKELVHDPLFLGLVSEPATIEDLEIARNLAQCLYYGLSYILIDNAYEVEL
jgi:hypothetical protein